jgi:peptidoglycan/xylan/chitin deacetylase (PgdA/CDA1 family)
MPDPRIISWTAQHLRLLLSRYRRDEASLLVFMFHALTDGSQVPPTFPVHPSQCNTTDQLRALVEFYLDVGYRFVGPTDVLSGLDGNCNVLLTFDDGYFNNSLARPILDEFQVPALFFISTAYVLEGKPYWPDVVYRRRCAGGHSRKDIGREISLLKSLSPAELESRLRMEFGDNMLKTAGDMDRPFRPHELAEFAKHPLVHLGNHTRDHAMLTRLDLLEARRQIASAQYDLTQISGVAPRAIAYPYGDYTTAVIQAAAAEGISLGFTTEKFKSSIPDLYAGSNLLQIGRLHLRNDRALATQLEVFRGRVRRARFRHRLDAA